MKLCLVCFTETGALLCQRLIGALQACGHVCTGFSTRRQAEKTGLLCYGEQLSLWVSQWFCKEKTDGIIFISACGIAVRAIAPFLRDKTVDPAVVVIDEQGRFVVSLLSGHIGNANQLARLAAGKLGATPVISTATDLCGRFAVDSWAAERGWKISSMALAKEASVRLLEGEPVGFASDVPIEGQLPEGLSADLGLDFGIWVSVRNTPAPFCRTLQILPKTVYVGIGCRKGATKEAIQTAVQNALLDAQIDFRAIKTLASVDRKEQEPGLQEFAAYHRLPIRFFSSQELAQAEGTFTGSAFVQQTVGVDNVCERAAVLGSGGGCLVIQKQAGNGITVAAALENWRVTFETANGGD